MAAIGLFLGTAVSLAVLGLVFQFMTQFYDHWTMSPKGIVYTINGTGLHLDCRGMGTPTIVLEGGALAFSSFWALVQNDLAETSRVCSYDRLGMGWSADHGERHDGIAAMDRLYLLLRAAKENGPFVLVGHSIGAPLAMIFAGRHPDDVVGLVLLDPVHPEILDRLPEARALKSIYTVYLRYARIYAVFGLLRATNTIGTLGAELPLYARREQESFLSNFQHLRAAEAELDAWDATMDAARQASNAIRSLPVMVISAENFLGQDDPILLQSWHALQEDMAKGSYQERYRILNSTYHLSLILDKEPARELSRAIKRFVAYTKASPTPVQ